MNSKFLTPLWVLLITLFVSQLVAAEAVLSGIYKRAGPPAPARPLPRPRPIPGRQEPPVLPEVPEAEMPGPDDASVVFSLGSIDDVEGNDALFKNFDGAMDPYFSKVFDFFAAQETYLEPGNPYADATGRQNPFKDGRPTQRTLRITRTVTSPRRKTITDTFDPSEPTDICSAWTSLVTYCGRAGTSCGCYSSTYYVPDQWNSLAAGCASFTTRCVGPNGPPAKQHQCQIAETAASYMSYCASDENAVKFAARAGTKGAERTPHRTPAADPTPSADPTSQSDAPAAQSTSSVAPATQTAADTTTTESTSAVMTEATSTPVSTAHAEPTSDTNIWHTIVNKIQLHIVCPFICAFQTSPSTSVGSSVPRYSFSKTMLRPPTNTTGPTALTRDGALRDAKRSKPAVEEIYPE
ncbi:MAG: hypothetical protein Q9227_009183 [Pyrenula ochraceoflavens]